MSRRMCLQGIFTIALLLCCSSIAIAQIDKKVEKATKTYNEGKREAGIKQMEKILKKEILNAKIWDILVQMKYFYYLELRETNNTLGLEDVLKEALNKTLSDTQNITVTLVSPANRYFREFVNSCIDATLLSKSTMASQILRTHFVDYRPDTAVSEEAMKKFYKAEDYFANSNFKKAKVHYYEALEEDPTFYQAMLYLGDSYWHQEQYDSAIHYFKECIERCPDLLEPRKYLADAFHGKKEYSAAYKECWNAIYIYPDEAMFLKVRDAAEYIDKKFNRHWIPRAFHPNSMDFIQPEIKDPNWALYRNAKADVEKYCDEYGIIEAGNPITKTTYLEVYSWEKMLEKADSVKYSELAFAKKMKEEGYLDCYVFISLFNHKYYYQFKHFIENNKTRVKEYVDKFLLEDE